MGRNRVPKTVKLTQATVEYLDGLCGPGLPFADRSHVGDWCVRHVKKLRLLRKPYTDRAPLPEPRPVSVGMTFAKDVFDYIADLSGPQLPFGHAAEGFAWCMEQARAHGFTPSKEDVAAAVAEARRAVAAARRA